MDHHEHPKQRKLFGLLFMSHYVDDIYQNFLPPLLPVLIVTHGLTYTLAVALVAVYNITAMMLQPLFGYIVDKHFKSWYIAASLIFGGLFMGLIGVAPSYSILLILGFLAGLGPASFHPQGAALISDMSDDKKGRMMSIWVAGGNIGFASSPLLIGLLVPALGIQSTMLFFIPAILMAGLLLREASAGKIKRQKNVLLMRDVNIKLISPLMFLVAVIAIRTWAYFGIISLLPIYFMSSGKSFLTSNTILSLMLVSAILGQILGGVLSDRYGRRLIVITSLASATPFLFLFLYTSGIPSLIFLLLSSFLIMASFSVTVVMGQEMIPFNVATVSGILIGAAMGIGSIGLLMVGIIADSMGIFFSLTVLAILPLIAAALTLPVKPLITSSNSR